MEHQTYDTVAQTREMVKILKGLSKERIQFIGGRGGCYCFTFTSHPPTQTHTHTHQKQNKKTFKNGIARPKCLMCIILDLVIVQHIENSEI